MTLKRTLTYGIVLYCLYQAGDTAYRVYELEQPKRFSGAEWFYAPRADGGTDVTIDFGKIGHRYAFVLPGGN